MVVWEVIANGYKAALGDDENVLKLDYMMVAQLCKYTNNH